MQTTVGDGSSNFMRNLLNSEQAKELNESEIVELAIELFTAGIDSVYNINFMFNAVIAYRAFHPLIHSNAYSSCNIYATNKLLLGLEWLT